MDRRGNGGARAWTLPLIGVLAAAMATAAGQNPAGKNGGEQPAAAPEPGKEAPSLAGPPAPGTFRLQSLTATIEGPAQGLQYSGRDRALEFSGQRLQIEEVLDIEFGGRQSSRQEALIILRSGEEIYAAIRDGTESELVFRAAAAVPAPEDFAAGGGEESSTAPLRAAIEKVHAIAFPSRFGSPAALLAFTRSLPGSRRGPIIAPPRGGSSPAPADAEAKIPDAEKDILITPEGSRIEGILERVKAAEIEFQADTLGRLVLPFEKVRAVILASLGGKPPGERPSGLQFSFTSTDGSRLAGELVEIGKGSVGFRSLALGPVRAALDRVQFIEVEGGRCQYLSDLDPIRVARIDALTYNPRPVQRDSNYIGGPLRLRGRTYRKGLGMISPVRLEYALEGHYDRFQAIIGLDDSARPTSEIQVTAGAANALFKIAIDGQTVLSKEISYRDPPLAVDIAIPAGARTLAIEAEHGHDGTPSLDFANWADARLIRR